MGDYLGYFLGPAGRGEIGVIAVRDTLSRDQLIDTLVEEWAHARTSGLSELRHGVPGQKDAQDPHHHPTFWAEYGRIQVAARAEVW